MIQLKKKEFAENVFAPKVMGTLALYEAFRDSKPDFFIMNSSLNAVTGGFGQVDYCSANAFMDAFAYLNDSRGSTRCVSVNWDRWPGVGMAVGIGNRIQSNPEELHPLIGKRIIDTQEKVVYYSQLSPKKDWVLSEHLVMGIPTVAGTTYLEMAKAAYCQIAGEGPVEINNVTFLTPLSARENETRDVLTILTANEKSFDFKVVTRLCSEVTEQDYWQEHVRGSVASAGIDKKNCTDINGLIEHLGKNTTYSNGKEDIGKDISEEFISFGKRWRTLRNIMFGIEEGIVEVELPEDLVEDLKIYKLHPALLDIATGAVRLATGGNYLPFSYEKIVIKEDLDKKIYGHFKFKSEYRELSETIKCDIDILNAEGFKSVEIKGFSMRYVNEDRASYIKLGNNNIRPIPESAELERIYGDVDKKQDIQDGGITVSEGLKALEKIMEGCYTSRVIVSTKDIQIAIDEAGYARQLKDSIESDEQAASVNLYPRPDLSCEYVAPKNDNEKELVKIWQKLLGVDGIGIYDDFFELGGDSLLLVQLHSKIKEKFKTDITAVDLYKYNTVALIAKNLESDHIEEKASFENLNMRVKKQREIMKQKREAMLKRKL